MEQLQQQIRSIIPSYDGQNTYSNVPNWLIQFIQYTILHDKITNLKEWKKYFRIVHGDPSKLYGGCFCNAMKKGKSLGNGFYGEVISAKYPCANYPGPIAIKIENIKLDYIDFHQMPDKVHKYVIIANKAAKLIGGPHIYETFLCVQEHTMSIIKIMDLVQGKSMATIAWKSTAHHNHATKMLIEKIKVLNRHGIVHNDLHEGNVMVNLNRGYVEEMHIIDYDRASLNIEADNLQDDLNHTNLLKLSNYIGSKIITESPSLWKGM